MIDGRFFFTSSARKYFPEIFYDLISPSQRWSFGTFAQFYTLHVALLWSNKKITNSASINVLNHLSLLTPTPASQDYMTVPYWFLYKLFYSWHSLHNKNPCLKTSLDATVANQNFILCSLYRVNNIKTNIKKTHTPPPPPKTYLKTH